MIAGLPVFAAIKALRQEEESSGVNCPNCFHPVSCHTLNYDERGLHGCFIRGCTCQMVQKEILKHHKD